MQKVGARQTHRLTDTCYFKPDYLTEQEGAQDIEIHIIQPTLLSGELQVWRQHVVVWKQVWQD